AVMSISSLIAEGAGRHTRLDFAHFISMAIASTCEVEHHLMSACDLGLLERTALEELLPRVIEVRQMLYGFRRALLARESEERAKRMRSIKTRNSDSSTHDS